MEQAGAVDPELQSSISNLVSALGGPDPETRKYKLGDEALACLRDLRKWLQLYDANSDRLDVACSIGNTTLVSVDLVEILGDWERAAHYQADAYMDRVALACLELLVPLTWPLEVIGKENTVHYFSQVKFIQHLQAKYKRAILNHSSHGILRAAIRLATKSALRSQLSDRDVRDEGILSLVCLLFRNLARIDSGDDEDRKDTVTEFASQKVLSFLVMMGAEMGSNFDKQDTIVLECLYYLLRGVDIAKMYGVEARDETVRDPMRQNLQQMLETEADMNRTMFKPSRHSRFGTMIAMNEGEGEWISVSGQRAIMGLDSTLTKIDESKNWHRRSTRPVTDDREKAAFVVSAESINSDTDTLSLVSQFANEFLDASFNPLFVKVRKLVERQQPRITKQNLIQFLSLVAWFLEAERSRCEAAKQPVDFKLVGGLLNRGAISVVLSLLSRGMEPGELQSTELVEAAMLGFRHILTYVRMMSHSTMDEYIDAAESIKSRLFYEETWLNLLAQLPRQAANKSLSYACEAVQLTHVVLKMLDEYSKQHTYMFVKSTRARKGRKSEAHEDIGEVEDEQDHREAVRVTNERKFSFAKYVTKYIHEATIDTYERVLSSYRDVSESIILHVFSFFRRTFASTEFKAYFYRLSLMRLLLTLVGHRGLPHDSRARGIADQFLVYYVRKFVSTVQQMPSLHIQVNEVMTPADAFYYDHGGHDKEVYRPPRFELELKTKACDNLSAERRFSIVVAAMIDRGHDDYVKWAEDAVSNIIVGGSEPEDVVDAPNKGKRLVTQPLTNDKGRIKQAHGDALIRLFLRSLGLIVNTTVGQIVFPSSIDEAQTIERLQWVHKYRSEPVEFERGKEAMSFIKVQGEREVDEYEDETDEEMQPRLQGTLAQRAQTASDDPEQLDQPTSDQRPQAIARDPIPEPSRKRSQLDAFALDDSDDDNEEISLSVANMRRKHRAIDDEDDE